MTSPDREKVREVEAEVARLRGDAEGWRYTAAYRCPNIIDALAYGQRADEAEARADLLSATLRSAPHVEE